MTILFFFSYLAIAQPNIKPDLPPPANGYSWQWIAPIKAAFLKPDDWHIKDMARGDTHGVFITREVFNPPQRFETGLTVNAIRNVRARHGVNPSQYAQIMLEKARLTHDLLREWDRNIGTLQGKAFLYDIEDGGRIFRIFNLLVANNATGTIYLILFEAPREDWERVFPTAETILQNLHLNENI